MKIIDKHLSDEIQHALKEYKLPESVEEKLLKAHDEDVIEYVTGAISQIRIAFSVANNFKIKPSKVNSEMKRVKTALDQLSPFTHLHIMMGLSNASPSDSAASSFDKSSAFLDCLEAVLGTEYDNEILGRDPARNVLINSVKHIDTVFIKPFFDYSDYDDEDEQRASNGWKDLEEITEIIIDESGIDASAGTVVKEVRKKE